jgi:type IX secretion system PorP/SprF family membrane protein
MKINKFMNYLTRKRTIVVLCLLSSLSTFAQLNDQRNLYFFNPLFFNPSTAGVNGVFSADLIVRRQWTGLEGSPSSSYFSMDTVLKKPSVSLGFHCSQVHIGHNSRSNFSVDYAHSLYLDKRNGRKLNVGLSAGGEHLNVINKNASMKDSIVNQVNYSTTMNLNVGIGIYFHSQHFSTGVGIPRLLEPLLLQKAVNSGDILIRRSAFYSAGYNFQMGENIESISNFLVRVDSKKNVVMELGTSAAFMKQSTFGVFYRFEEAIGFHLSHRIFPRIDVGYAFDYPIQRINWENNLGSHEIRFKYRTLPVKANIFKTRSRI